MKFDTGSSSDPDRTEKQIRLLLAEGRPIVREALFHMMQRWPDIEVAGKAGDTRNVLLAIREMPLDVVLLSTSIRGRGFFDLIKRIHAQVPGLPVVAVGFGVDKTHVARALRAGVRGYLSDDGTLDELAKAVRAARVGEMFVSRSLGDVLGDLLKYPQNSPEHARLSNREYEVLCLLGAGKAISSIAPQLGLSAKTISTYRARLLRKLNLKSSGELIRYAIENDLTGEVSRP